MRLIDADKCLEDLGTVNPVYKDRIKWAKNIIEAMPTVEPRPKGKWIRGKIDNKDVWYCSNCKHIDDYYGPTANYCWYCGEDMRGDENE